MTKEQKSLSKPGDFVLGKLFIDEGAGQGLEILEGQVRDVDGDLVLDQARLEAEAHLLSALGVPHGREVSSILDHQQAYS